jgi:acetolactate synthase-1/2/3 large subunit
VDTQTDNEIGEEGTVSAPTTRPQERSETPPANGEPAAPGGTNTATSASKQVAPHQLTGAQAVIRALEELDVEVIFGIPGGAV